MVSIIRSTEAGGGATAILSCETAGTNRTYLIYRRRHCGGLLGLPMGNRPVYISLSLSLALPVLSAHTWAVAIEIVGTAGVGGDLVIGNPRLAFDLFFKVLFFPFFFFWT